MVSLQQWLQTSVASLEGNSKDARVDVEYILTWALGKERTFVFTWPDTELTPRQLAQANSALARRIKGEPIAHILGEREFWSLRFLTNASTLIPRADTEMLVETVLSLPLKKNSRVLDLGTGTGAIALAIAKERPEFIVHAVDNFPDVVALAKKNAQQHQLSNVEIWRSNWFSTVKSQYDVVVSNPPYIDKEDPHLLQGDLAFEPNSALVAEENGLADIRHIVENSRSFLLPQAFLVLEHGWQQKAAVQALMQHQFINIQTRKDYGGNERVTYGQLS